MKKIIIYLGLILVIAILIIGFILNMKKNIAVEQSDNKIKMQLIQLDVADGSKSIIKEYEVEVNDIINLEQYYGNNINILEINENKVKISRDATRYKIISQNSVHSGVSKKYIETVISNVDYGLLISININASDPFGPLAARPRYEYKVKFIK